MKKILFIVLLLTLNILSIDQTKAFSLECNDLDGSSIFGYDSFEDEYKYIGSISNKYDSNSIANEYGAGSKYETDSINNEYGDFGSKYSSYSAFNEYASYPPIIINDDLEFIGYLTINEYTTPAINSYNALACASESLQSSISEHEDITFEEIPESSYIYEDNSTDSVCIDTENGFLGSDGMCYCNKGYEWSDNENKCIVIINNEVCEDLYGNAYSNNGTCSCKEGYLVNQDTTACITPTESCQELYGESSYSDGVKQDNGLYNCYCKEGYYFNDNMQCALNVIDTTENNTNKTDQSPFYDLLISNKNYTAIIWLYNHSIISGYPDGSFKPENTINRAELLTILVRTTSAAEDLNYAGASVETPPPCFTDVDVDAWYNAYVCTAKKYGWVEGYDNNTFKPDQPVTKAEAIKMLLVIHNIHTTSIIYNSAFEDVKATDWYAPYLQIAKDKAILEETGTYYDPNGNMTRGSISESLYRLMNQ
ncbi:MAG: hypothetical protein UR28_C0016G0001 [Candidatus Peregrinibacteria bacterium GW2011_GWF2_33_10]|nr:MAG: hypothetical protein UR28_C0016G0001 [Candidatus Peregrinibacteria bacterium GW2011_GWF2_33_10]OGJ45850.1 MAG: hypothetical protein A2263_03600 [Candidatus Peregrinibacteria bacterium RIFOXYA2_FULL_33_21]OGJ51358.1 MAG: hypothetical protein A2307_02295 [Candidatus Peregrinibacteria bacterium RIFOXYB2_FULL_33_20]